MSWVPPATMEDEYNAYNQVTTDHQFIGETGAHDEPAYYHVEHHSVETGDINEEGELVPTEDGES